MLTSRDACAAHLVARTQHSAAAAHHPLLSLTFAPPSRPPLEPSIASWSRSRLRAPCTHTRLSRGSPHSSLTELYRGKRTTTSRQLAHESTRAPPHSYALLGSTLKTVGAASWGRQERALLRSSHIDSSSPHSYAAPLSTLRTSGAVAWREPHKPRELPPISHHKGGSMSAPASCTATPQKLRAGSPVAQPATSVSCTTTPYRLRRGQAAGRQLPCLGPNLGMGQSVSAPKRRARSKPPSDAPTGG